MLGIIGGTSLLYADIPNLEKKTVSTPFGPAEVYLGDIALMMRHQFSTPPHKINFAATISAMKLCGVDRILSIGSTGSLKNEIAPGMFVIPDDYFSYAKIPTIYNNTIGHSATSVDLDMRCRLHEIIPDAVMGGTYVQTAGPRFETPAEIKTLKAVGDIVGMTVASEATIANELNIPFAALCSVDNYCNGLCHEILSYEAILKKAKAGKERIEKTVRQITEKL